MSAYENATPRPWTADEDYIFAGGKIVATISGDGISIEADFANTSLIVEAVNAYDTLRAENKRLRADNERLRWRHPTVIPDWNDLPEKLRRDLVCLGESYSDDTHGGDFAVNFYGDIKDALSEAQP